MTDFAGLALVISAVLTPMSVVGLAFMNRRDANKAAVKVEEVKTTAAEQAGVLSVVAETVEQVHGLVNSDMTKTLQANLAALRSLLALQRRPDTVDDAVVAETEARIKDLELTLAQRAQTAQDMENGLPK